MDNDKPTTLTGFTAKTQGEIDRHMFAAKTGGLVSLGSKSFWELFDAATAWHEHLAALPKEITNDAEEAVQPDGQAQVPRAIGDAGAQDVDRSEAQVP